MTSPTKLSSLMLLSRRLIEAFEEGPAVTAQVPDHHSSERFFLRIGSQQPRTLAGTIASIDHPEQNAARLSIQPAKSTGSEELFLIHSTLKEERVRFAPSLIARSESGRSAPSRFIELTVFKIMTT